MFKDKQSGMETHNFDRTKNKKQIFLDKLWSASFHFHTFRARNFILGHLSQNTLGSKNFIPKLCLISFGQNVLYLISFGQNVLHLKSFGPYDICFKTL